MVGWAFTTGSLGFKVCALGILDLPNGDTGFPTGADGLCTEHEIGIWEHEDDGGALLGSVTVPASTNATLIDNFRYVDLIPAINLLPSTRYVLGAHYRMTMDPELPDAFWDVSQAGSTLQNSAMFLDSRRETNAPKGTCRHNDTPSVQATYEWNQPEPPPLVALR